jgi:uncharacterized membrane protein YcaP (DUF421 family)
MPSDILHLPPIAFDLLAVAMHTAVIYIGLILGLRLIGRRQMGQLTVVDLVIIILLGSAVETAMVSGNTTLPAGLVCAATLFITNRLLSVVCYRSDRLRHLVAGDTMLLVNNGEILRENLRRSGLTDDDLMASLRARGQAGLDTVRYAMRETDGSITVVPCDDTELLQSDIVVGGGPVPAPSETAPSPSGTRDVA